MMLHRVGSSSANNRNELTDRTRRIFDIAKNLSYFDKGVKPREDFSMSQPLNSTVAAQMPLIRCPRFARCGIIAAVSVALYCLLFTSMYDSRIDAAVPKGTTRIHGSATATDLETLLVALESNDQEVSASARAALRKHHDRLVERLSAIAKVPQKEEVWGSPKGRAIELLALYGAQNAAPFLVENIEYREQGLTTERDSLAGYLSAKALRTLGATSTPEILRHLRMLHAEDVPDKAIELYAMVFTYVYHAEGGTAEAIGVVERARDRTRVDQRANLDRLFNCISGRGKSAP